MCATVQPVSRPHAPPSPATPFFLIHDAAGRPVDDARRGELARVTVVARPPAPRPGEPGWAGLAADSVDVALRNAPE